MAIARLDLADATSPERLVVEILKHEPNLVVPVAIKKLCTQLDIIEFRPLTTSNFEGGLITDVDKHSGIILFNETSPKKRRRFTIAHELGHFLMRSHVPNKDGRFLCSQEDMFELTDTEQNRRLRMEVEANRFASLILMPPPLFRVDVGLAKDPDLQQIAALSNKYQVSMEAISRAYVSFRRNPVAIIIVQYGHVLRYYKDDRRFPFISVSYGSPVPPRSLFFRGKHQEGSVSLTESGN